MSLPFIINNLHFTVELIGALCFLVMAWLAADAYIAGKQARQLWRVLGFCSLGVAQLLHTFNISNDLLGIGGGTLVIFGLLLIIVSFFTGPKIASFSYGNNASNTQKSPALLFIPAFSSVAVYFDILAAVAFSLIAFLSIRQMQKEFDRSQKYFWMGFFALALGVLAALFWKGTNGFIVEHMFRLVGFSLLSMWVWQYLKLRLRESVVLIFISLTLFIATIVTLAFSTILMSKIEAETRTSLSIDTRVIDLAVDGLREEARVKAALLSEEGDMTNALKEKNSAKLEGLLTDALDREKLGFLLVTDVSGTVLLRAHALSRYGDSLANESAVASALIGEPKTVIESSPVEQFSIRAATPLLDDGEIVGVLVAGYPLDNVFADRMKKVTGLEMSVYEGEKVVATTALATDGRTRLSGISVLDKGVVSTVLVNGKETIAHVELRGEQFLASYVPLMNGEGEVIGMLSASKPQQEIIALANATNRLTLISVMTLLLILALPLYALTRRLLGETF
ncbi:MAG: cache domain-containing protein [bacterium]|nr:cache domain-containing protein [bacterium]